MGTQGVMEADTHHNDVIDEYAPDGDLRGVHPDVDAVDEEPNVVGGKVKVIEVKQEAFPIVLVQRHGGEGQLIVSPVLGSQS